MAHVTQSIPGIAVDTRNAVLRLRGRSVRQFRARVARVDPEAAARVCFPRYMQQNLGSPRRPWAIQHTRPARRTAMRDEEIVLILLRLQEAVSRVGSE